MMPARRSSPADSSGRARPETRRPDCERFDAHTGAPVGTIDDSDYAPSISGAFAVTGSVDGRVTGRDASTGEARWRFVAQGPIRGPAIAGGVVYLGSDTERRVYALDGATGDEYWSFDVDASNSCCIAVAQGDRGGGHVGGDDLCDRRRRIADGRGGARRPALADLDPRRASASPSASNPPPDPFTVERRFTPDQLGLDVPLSIAVGPSGNVYVSDTSDHVSAISPDGTVLHRWGGTGSGKGKLDFTPAGAGSNVQGSLAVGPDGTVYVSDSDNHRIQAFTADGTFVRQFGSIGSDPGRAHHAVRSRRGPGRERVRRGRRATSGSRRSRHRGPSSGWPMARPMPGCGATGTRPPSTPVAGSW